MATPHNKAEKGHIAETVLMPGDPLRAKFIADTYLENVVKFNDVRNMLGYTGLYKGTRVSAMGSGMGIPSIAIYTEELCKFHDVKKIIRVGSCGAFQDYLKVFDIVIAMSACTDSAFNDRRFQGATYAPTADFQLVRKAYEAAVNKGIEPYVGTILATDLFYGIEGEDIPWKLWAKYGVLAVEMESAALYTIAARYGIQALTLLTVSDSLVSKQETTPEERERSFHAMMEIALDII
ncbi:MAG: purine-nucleoside phosphorylase [Spirochaetales bacterium]|nr:purine-nucleoside phosphorylase [Spirochaetales bacterium]